MEPIHTHPASWNFSPGAPFRNAVSETVAESMTGSPPLCVPLFQTHLLTIHCPGSLLSSWHGFKALMKKSLVTGSLRGRVKRWLWSPFAIGFFSDQAKTMTKEGWGKAQLSRTRFPNIISMVLRPYHFSYKMSFLSKWLWLFLLPFLQCFKLFARKC